jgi:protein involved in polysaccharide export with SLBB domain
MSHLLAHRITVALMLIGGVLDGGALGAQSSEGGKAATQDGASGVRPGDAVRLRIWREPDLSGDFGVNEAGVVVLPRIGPITLQGTSADSVRAQLFERYRAILSHNSIEVVLLRRVQVLGAVRNPGLYSLDPTMTIGDAVALAGGATQTGDQKRVRLIRQDGRPSERLAYHTRVIDSRARSGDQLFVPERGWVVRHETLLVSAATSVVGVLIAIWR